MPEARYRAALPALALLVALAGTTGTAHASDPAAGTLPRLVNAAGLHVKAVRRVDARLLDVTVTTTALAMPAHVNILLPPDYQPSKRRYPVIYLLHGGTPSAYTGDEYQAWVTQGNVENITSNTQAIVVMPEGGADGWYTNWVNAGRGGPPEWETFHVAQLVPWIDRNFATVPNRADRAIAGLSMGGFGAMSYAARHPSVFGVAASFSGGDDTTYPAALMEPVVTPIVNTSASFDGGGFDSIFGSHEQDEINWRARDPERLVRNLSDTRLYLYAGNGLPGPLDTPTSAVAGSIETIVHLETTEFHEALDAAGISNFYDDYGPGTHSWPYWQRDLDNGLPRMMSDFRTAGQDRAHPAFAYQTDLARYSSWGWSVKIRRNAQEFSTLAVRTPHRFTILGSGSAIVTTPPDLKPHSLHRVTFARRAGHTTRRVRADGDGRLRISVVLGPANPYREFTAAAAAHGGTKKYRAEVVVS